MESRKLKTGKRRGLYMKVSKYFEDLHNLDTKEQVTVSLCGSEGAKRLIILE